MRYLVRYLDQPIKFTEPGGKQVASVVPVSMATRFESLNAAYERSVEQWGDTGLEKVKVSRDEENQPTRRTQSTLP